MPELTKFQKAAVDRIVQRLSAVQGSRRFLLADEVGLGKTLVARGVVEKLAQQTRRRTRGFTVIYICSNLEIGEQNRDKLIPSGEAACSFTDRLTLLPLQSQAVQQLRQAGQLQVFSFTPGTSLHIGRATGIRRERRMLGYLLRRVLQIHITDKWRTFFQCGIESKNWQDFKSIDLTADFHKLIADGYVEALERQLRTHCVKLKTADSKEYRTAPSRLLDCLEEVVEAYCKRPKGDSEKANQRIVIGALRYCAATVALDYLSPDLIILDEFQRFKDVLSNARKRGTIEYNLFAKQKAAVLIMSATPYKMYTPSHDNEDHHTDFLDTFSFLVNKDSESTEVSTLTSDIRAFRERLEGLHFKNGSDETLLARKRTIEDALTLVMCRTERSRVLHGVTNGVLEIPAVQDAIVPDTTELVDYFQLRRFLMADEKLRREYSVNITDFWKSSPSLLSFMNAHYALIRHLRSQGRVIPDYLLLREQQLGRSFLRNLKCRQLFAKVFQSRPESSSQCHDVLKGSWKYLWMPPTYQYYEDAFFGDDAPHKFLVFSHWRFVPKALSYLLSHEVERMLKITRGRKSLSPLQFSTKCSFYLFDVCCPSLVLALAVNQVSLSAACDDVPRARSLVAKAERQLRKSVLEAGITIGKTRAKHLWRVIARLESKSQYAGVVRDAFADTAVRSLDGTSDRYAKYREQYMEWLDDTDTPLKVSKRDIRRLAQIALFSPAVSILRAVIHAKCKSEGVLASAESLQECLTETTNLCMNQLRNYFNRDLAQAVIRRHGGPGSYTSQVLEYCCRAQFQAVVDEYVYLVRCVLQREGTKKVCKHLAEVLGMYSGSPSINHRGTHGKISSAGKPKSAHFALAFGEDVVASDDSGKERRSRKSAVREAFNSPFWPFVLATTSVGQEGLDFHLYCKDVVHWNLPGNPVDLEQREGRINRYDGLCIRRSIAAEHPLRKLPPFQEGKVGNPWEWVFDNLAATPQDNRDSQGLFPHWVYPSTNGQQEMIRRHVLFYSDSVDRGAYDRLKESLMLYRLVFGQPRQQDLLEHVADELAKIEEGEKRDMLLKTLPKYMIDLSPVSDGAGAN